MGKIKGQGWREEEKKEFWPLRPCQIEYACSNDPPICNISNNLERSLEFEYCVEDINKAMVFSTLGLKNTIIIVGIQAFAKGVFVLE